jgi:hypothetical protein
MMHLPIIGIIGWANPGIGANPVGPNRPAPCGGGIPTGGPPMGGPPMGGPPMGGPPMGGPPMGGPPMPKCGGADIRDQLRACSTSGNRENRDLSTCKRRLGDQYESVKHSI